MRQWVISSKQNIEIYVLSKFFSFFHSLCQNAQALIVEVTAMSSQS